MNSENRRSESERELPRKERFEGAATGSEPADPRDPGRPRHWDSETLLAGLDEAIILHGDETYRLRRTRNGKLILVK